MIKVKRTKTNSIPHEVYEKYSSTRVHIFPAPGRGLVAGSSVRSVLDLAGITDVSAKILSRSKNKINKEFFMSVISFIKEGIGLIYTGLSLKSSVAVTIGWDAC